MASSHDGAGHNSLPEFGSEVLKHFLFDSDYRNLNHGSFGTIPRHIQNRLRHYQELYEARPDQFIRYDLPKLLDKSREAVAKLLNAPTETVVFVPNATIGINTVLRNLVWNDDGRDEILYFNTVYGSCGKTIDYIVDSNSGLVSAKEITIAYPFEDDEAVAKFRHAVDSSRSVGKRPRVCLYDTISSLPGVVFPFENITRECRKYGVLSLVDGAQGIGQIKLDLTALDADFFTTNCHKWLHTPRGCAILYVPLRNQALVPSTLPTSHGYVAKTGARFNPLPPTTKSPFVSNFEFVGTVDASPFLCAKDAVKWREEVLGGEDRIMAYTEWLAREGGKKAAQIVGTKIMDNKTRTLTKCALVNIAMPIHVSSSNRSSSATTTSTGYSSSVSMPTGEASVVCQWMSEVLVKDYKTFIPFFISAGQVWARLSAQVYLDMRDFEWAGKVLLDLAQRVGKREYKIKERL
ncbi:uncharacterized protein JN550_011209 [Neoarthrinium moseri]|uniref:uncharacterized protein n=1 Tax=Neoarthrinium moseri TaxID=1658444 RepID=UPI001FDE8844|nr:uncharacterized protein JN550_011209 [Neoarthrinium moseri]KAI1860894.1 hypothetical protein JN550_011209 [Neoarthrinium moseri]